MRTKRKKELAICCALNWIGSLVGNSQLGVSCGKGMEFERFDGGFDIEDMIDKSLASDSDIHRF